MNYEVAKDVVSYCGKCKLRLAHIIVTLKDAQTIHKVKCKTCQGVHAFKEEATTKSGVAKVLKNARKGRKAQDAVETWEQKVKKSDPIKYTIRGDFKSEDVIDHSKFGLGSVEQVVDGNKIEVSFRDGSRILVHNK
ncbi:hypothetical protein OAB57_03135 [Bacteriovoracaceae bacterium]|nr:hypothetical protein [Bacteriovoracaceae bacterium]